MSAPPQNAPELVEEVRDDLEPGEEVVWISRPDPWGYSRQAWPAMLFGLVFGGSAVLWIVSAWTTSRKGGDLGTMTLFGIPFLLVGAFMALAPVSMRRAARGSLYVITTRRAITRLRKAWGTTEVTSFRADRLTSLIRSVRRDGSGDLIFEKFTTKAGSGHTVVRRGFVGLRDVREVERILTDTVLRRVDRTGTETAIR